MKTMQLAGRAVYPIGLGTWHMGDDPAKTALETAALRTGIEAGAQVIDTAEMYGEGNAERLVGQAIQPYSREALFLISKVYPWNASAEQLPLSLAASLQRLQTDYLDLYLLHWQGAVPLAETVTALEEAQNQGLIRAWGVSNFDMADLLALYDLPQGCNCQANQVLYNLGSRGIEFDLLPWQQHQQLPLIAYSPIAQGDSLGSHLTQQPLLQQLAKKYDCSIFQLLLAWCIRDGRTLAIPQSSQPDHVQANIQAGALTLRQAELQQLAELFPKPASKQPLAVL